MADSISKIAIVNNNNEDVFKARWGSTVYDYKLNGVPTDLQDLMVLVSESRAIAVEGEVEPLSKRMRNRNNYLEELGSALAEFSKLQASFKSDDEGSTLKSISAAADLIFLLNKAGCQKYYTHYHDTITYYFIILVTKADVEAIITQLKSVIDTENNAAQSDMSRLQSLVDRRDESYTTATNLMTSISDTRDNAIRNF